MTTLQQQLDEALTVRHQLMLGKATVSLQFGERRVEYSKANLADLESYISSLRRQIAGKRPQRGRITYVVPC